MIVVDATVWVERLLGRLDDDLAAYVESGEATSPPHVDFEVGSALVRMWRRGDLDGDRLTELVAGFMVLPFDRMRDPADAAGAVAVAHNATYADAWYVVMAKRLGCPLLTLDAGMREAARIHGGVALIPEKTVSDPP